MKQKKEGNTNPEPTPGLCFSHHTRYNRVEAVLPPSTPDRPVSAVRGKISLHAPVSAVRGKINYTYRVRRKGETFITRAVS